MSKRHGRRRHWSKATFVITDKGYGGAQHGYCRECCADMAYYPPRPSHGSIGIPQGLQHYNSHKRAIARGMWGRR